MQRRAAAVSVAFFLVVSAASYGLVATAEEPTIGFEDPEYALSPGQSFELDGQEYTVTTIDASMESSGGGHGGGGGETLVRSGEIAWTNEDARYTTTWDNGSSVTLDNESYTVHVDAGEEPTGFTLQKELNRTAILQDDPDAENKLLTDDDGNEWVVINRDGNRTLVAPEEYFPEPETQDYEEGDSLEYDGQNVVVDDVSADQITLAWTAPRENTASLNHLENVSIQGSTYLAFFPNNDTVYLTQNFDAYHRQSNQIDRHHEYVNGLWGVNILSALAAVVLIGLAYMPSRY